MVPQSCEGVPAALLNPRNTWTHPTAYDTQAAMLANLFNKNFEKYASGVTDDIRAAAPKI
jgi:phosphoenolpyruvate carboxykinase (ATP)